MSRLKVSGFGVSIDGYGAGPHQNLDNPLGVGGTALMCWRRPKIDPPMRVVPISK